MYLFYDTETSGFINGNITPTDPKQGRLIQIGAQLLDEDLCLQAEFATIVRPAQPYNMSSGALAIHGIHQDQVAKYGMTTGSALNTLSRMADKATILVCHNSAFDTKVIANEDATFTDADYQPTFKPDHIKFCTMNVLTPIMRLPKKRGSGFKWPKLQEAHKFLFGCEFESAHDAMEDIRATVRVFIECKSRYPSAFNT